MLRRGSGQPLPSSPRNEDHPLSSSGSQGTREKPLAQPWEETALYPAWPPRAPRCRGRKGGCTRVSSPFVSSLSCRRAWHAVGVRYSLPSECTDAWTMFLPGRWDLGRAGLLRVGCPASSISTP